MTDPQPTATIAGHSIGLRVNGYPDIPNRWGSGHIRVDTIRLDYGSHRTPAARHAELAGLWIREDGEATDQPIDRYYDAPDGDTSTWPDWVAGLAKAHTPELPPHAARAAVLRDFLWRLEQSSGYSTAEKLIDDNPDLAALLAAETPQPETQAAPVSPTAALLASRCDACLHTLNWHRNDVGCTVVLCVCSRFQPPVDDAPAVVQADGEAKP